MIKFSIVIPIYNAEQFLEKCLNSITNQTYKNLEIICVNDGSTDNSVEIISKLNDSRIKIINQENSGALIARNNGIRAATGDYISFVDADDWVDINMYEVLSEYIQQYSNPDVIRFNYIKEPSAEKSNDGFKNVTFPYESKMGSNEIYRLLIDSVALNTLWRGVFKKELFENNLIEERVTASNDVLQMYMILDRTERIVFLNNYFYHYNYNPNSIVHTINIDRICDNLKSMLFFRQKSIDYLKKWNICTTENLKKYALFTITYENDLLIRVMRHSKNKSDVEKMYTLIFENDTHNEIIKYITKKEISDRSKIKNILKRAIYTKNISVIKFFRLFLKIISR